MKSRSSSRTSRRGLTLPEVLIASGLLSVLLTASASLLSTAARTEQAMEVQRDTDKDAAHAMQRITLDIREANEVSVLASDRFRIYYPLVTPEGRYDRTRRDYTKWVQYAQTNASGMPTGTGTYLWRSTESHAGRAVAENLRDFRIQAQSDKAVRLTMRLQKNNGRGRSGQTHLNQRVLFLRNR